MRPATLEDTEPVRRVGLLAWPETYAFAGEDFVRQGLEQWWSPEAVQRSLVTTTTLVAELEATVVGMGNVDLRGEVPVVWKLYVLPEHRGPGHLCGRHGGRRGGGRPAQRLLLGHG